MEITHAVNLCIKLYVCIHTEPRTICGTRQCPLAQRLWSSELLLPHAYPARTNSTKSWLPWKKITWSWSVIVCAFKHLYCIVVITLSSPLFLSSISPNLLSSSFPPSLSSSTLHFNSLSSSLKPRKQVQTMTSAHRWSQGNSSVKISYVDATLPSGSGSTSTSTSLRPHLRESGWKGE